MECVFQTFFAPYLFHSSSKFWSCWDGGTIQQHYLKCGFRPISSTCQNLMWRDRLIFTKFWKPLYKIRFCSRIMPFVCYWRSHTEVFRTLWKFEGLVTSNFDIRTDSWKPRLCNHCSSGNNISTCTSKHPSFYVTGDSLSPVRFPTCQFYQSKFDVTRLCNFHKVLKTSVSSNPIFVETLQDKRHHLLFESF